MLQGDRVTRAQHKRNILRDLAAILGKDDDLMPNEIDDESRDGKAWQAARDELVEEFERRATSS
jgi:hypothetical protein